jgi:hypothetical protein
LSLGPWKYWLLMLAVMAVETARQQGLDSLFTASLNDVLLLAIIGWNWRRLTLATYMAIAVAIGFVLAHNAVLDLPVEIGAFGARSVVYLTATADIISSADRELVWSKRGVTTMAIVWGVAAAYAIYQQVTGFRYSLEADYYNAAPMAEEDTSLVRIPSFFYNFGTYAKFCLSGMIVLMPMVERSGARSKAAVGVVAASVIVGIVLSGQRAALAAAVVSFSVFLFRARNTNRAVLISLVLLGAAAAWITFPLYFQRAESAASFERVDSNFIDGVPNALAATPLLTGLGMGRPTSAAQRYDRRFQTSWAINQLDYDGAEGIFHFALSQGGLPWVFALFLCICWAARPGAGRIAQSFVLSYTVWGVTHDIWGSPQPCLLLLITVLGARDLGISKVAARPDTAPPASVLTLRGAAQAHDASV